MAINLNKIHSDLNHDDPQIQTFALMSITRLSPELVNSAEEVQSIHGKLSELVLSENSDVVFLARKAINHIDSVFKPYLKETQPKVPVNQDPQTMSREELLIVLDSALDPKYLASVAVRFIAVGKHDDLSSLTPFLRHENDRVRSNVVEVFETHGSMQQVDLIKPLLADPNNRVRGNAIIALVAMGYDDVGNDLNKMLCMGMVSMRETAVYVLSCLSLPFVEKLLVKATSDPYEGVRVRATRALSRFVSPVAITRLRQLMNDIDINICEAAIESLRKIKASHEANKRGKVSQSSEEKQKLQKPPSPVQESTPAVNEHKLTSKKAEELDIVQQHSISSSVQPLEQSSSDILDRHDEDILDRHDEDILDRHDEDIDDSNLVTSHPDSDIENNNQATVYDDSDIDDSMERKIIVSEALESSDDLSSLEATELEKHVKFRELGTSVYQLCRTNSLSHHVIDTIFYEILRYQDFLRAYLSKKRDVENGGNDNESKHAIKQLQLKIEEAFVKLGEAAFSQINNGSLDVSGNNEIIAIVAELN